MHDWHELPSQAVFNSQIGEHGMAQFLQNHGLRVKVVFSGKSLFL